MRRVSWAFIATIHAVLALSMWQDARASGGEAAAEEAGPPPPDPDGLPDFTPENTVVGPATVVDGQSLRIGKRTIRLFGIEAPQLDAVCTLPTGGRIYCGRSARKALDDMLRGTSAVCLPWPEGQQGDSITAFCKVSTVNGALINRRMIENGSVYAYPKRLRDKSWPTLDQAAEQVRIMHLGVYTYDVVPPWSGAPRERNPLPGTRPGSRESVPAPALPPDPMAGG